MSSSERSELGCHTGLVAASALGLTAGMSATMFYSMGAFIPPLQAEFGWSRADISLSFTSLTIGLFCAGPMAGRISDRIGAAKCGAYSLILYAGVLAALGLSPTPHVQIFWLAYFLIALVGAGTTPVVMVRPIAATFRRQRGIALGIALTGAAIAGFWVPQLVTAVTQAAGWRSAYLALAAIALAAVPLVWVGLRPSAAGSIDAKPVPVAEEDGMAAPDARRTSSFWLLTGISFAMAIGMAGIVIHLVPLFRDQGYDPLEAAAIASVIGLAGTTGRLGVGLFLDRFPAPWVATAIFILAGGGMLMLWSGLSPLAAVILIGLATGAEVDLLAFLTVRYFGPRAFSTLYGWQYGVFALGYGLSPFAIGLLRDALGNYDLAILLCAVCAGVAAILSWSLRLTKLEIDAMARFRGALPATVAQSI